MRICIAIVFFSSYDVINFENDLLSQAVFLHDLNVKRKI